LIVGYSALFLPLVLVLRLISPIILVRVGFIASATGQAIHGCENYLQRKSLGLEPKRSIDVFFFSHPLLADEGIVEILKNGVQVPWRPLIRGLWQANALVPGKSRHLVDLGTFSDPEDLFAQTPPLLVPENHKVRSDFDALRSVGLEPGEPFVCFHVRDSAYGDANTPRRDKTATDYRNARTENYWEAIQALVSRGYKAVRMGAIVSTDLPQEMDGVIDYARSGLQSGYMDAVLSSQCAFWLGTPAGASMFAIITRRPIVFVDCIPMGIVSTWRPNDLYIPKKLRKADGQFATIWEVLRGEIGWPEMRNGRLSHTQDMYDSRDLTIIDNSPAEIRAVAEEMDDRLTGKVRIRSEREERIQTEIVKLYEASQLHGVARARLGSDFIATNPELVAPL